VTVSGDLPHSRYSCSPPRSGVTDFVQAGDKSHRLYWRRTAISFVACCLNSFAAFFRGRCAVRRAKRKAHLRPSQRRFQPLTNRFNQKRAGTIPASLPVRCYVALSCFRDRAAGSG